jgi:hypothetical protein
MRAAVWILSLALAVSWPCGCQIRSIQDAVASALGWHFRWIEAVPRGIPSIDCHIAIFDERSFAYCESVSLSIDIETIGLRDSRVVTMVYEYGGLEHALAEFREHRNPGRALERVQRVSVSTEGLGRCRTDWNRTERAVATVLSPSQKGPLQRKGLQLRYPRMCENDPFYLLYLIQDNRIRSIWQFEVAPSGFNFIWSYDAGTQQRKIPELAVENLKEDDLWYRPPK